MRTATARTAHTRLSASAGLPRLIAAAAVGALALAGLAVPSAIAADATASTSWLDAYFNNTGVGDAGSTYADIDGLGSYLVRSTSGGLPANTELTVPDTDLTYSISGAVNGTPDNVTASNQVIDTTASFGALATVPAQHIAFVGAATSGSKTITATLTFSDGSTQAISAQLSDWCDSSGQGTNVRIATWSQRWYLGSSQDLACGLWATETYTLTPTDPGATLASITLPDSPSFHIFAIASDAETDPGALTITGSGTATVTSSSATYGEAPVVLTVSGSPTWATSTVSPLPGVTANYSWTVNGQTVPGANQSTYTVRPADVATSIQAVITGRKGGYVSGTVTTNTVIVANGTIGAPTTPPVLTGTPQVGQKLTVSNGVYPVTGTTTSYAWYAGDTLIPGATSSALIVGSAQVGSKITVDVTAKRTGFTDQVTALGPTATVTKGVFTSDTQTTITGTYAVGQSLQAVLGSYSVTGVTTAYQWSTNDGDIVGANASMFTLTGDQVGKTITLTTTATKPGYETVTHTATGSLVSTGGLVTTATPAVTGDAVFGHPLTASAGSYDPADVTISYQWLANNAPIAGATSAMFRPTAAQVGKSLQVTVTASKTGYQDLASTVTAGTVLPETLTTAVAPVISKAAKVGTAVKVTGGSYSTTGVTLSYQWLVDGRTITRATKATYTPTAKDRRKGLSVRVTAVKPGYETVTTNTAQITVKAGRIKVTKKPAIKNAKKKSKVAVGKKLKATKGSYSPKSVKVSYQWYRGSKAIKGKSAKKATYKVAKADKRKKLKVRITVKKAGYTTIKVKTKATIAVR